jgi:predicted hydrocarbon binding protein
VEKTNKRILAYHYSPTSKTFHVVAEIKNEPGALGRLLDKLGEQLDFITDLAYNTGKESAIFSGFAKPTSDKVSRRTIGAALKSLSVVKDSEVTESNEGILVDTLHSGITLDGNRRFALFPVDAMSSTFGEIAALLGSGAETILYNEGMTLGRINTEPFVSMLGADVLERVHPYTANIYGALGWGNVTVGERKRDGSFIIRVNDCFECASGGRTRQGCSFMRGHIASSVSIIYGEKYSVAETHCRFRGDKHCEFALAKVG